jgi:hypothetical protein
MLALLIISFLVDQVVLRTTAENESSYLKIPEA